MIRECFHQICLPKERQSNIVLKHKIERLSDTDLQELKDSVFLTRVKNQGVFSKDFSIYEDEPTII